MYFLLVLVKIGVEKYYGKLFTIKYCLSNR